ncbi:glycosyltransferase family 2 protein [Aquabacter spiritensis]|uniref:Glycosyltransferase involved in cell wall biosynthesis n=1 Tax=Aquabacter spiritensis TaxID=933073 RepID=A0A4R3LZ06_9HYPH|nr:glycosyltransferase family 2 protein [Aquabacter spiritensis]TCT03967.1 glycosyltransferase involved in cell wall biosynthesis [Aquabacter spiritensis]
MSCSVLILTYNEEANIADCIRSLKWRDDVHVLDSLSTDQTRRLAEDLGAAVHERAFTNYADQRMAGLALPFRHDWVVMLDADERVTPELAEEIDGLLAEVGAGVAMARVRRKDILFDRWLRRSSGYPTWFPRLIRRGRVRVEREINEDYIADGEVVHLSGHILHHPFAKGIDWWFERHNRYSAMEAHRLMAEQAVSLPPLGLAFTRDPAARRRVLKAWLYRMPARPLVVFVYLYVLRMGFLDGRAGYLYALMRMSYEVMIDAKMAMARGGR